MSKELRLKRSSTSSASRISPSTSSYSGFVRKGATLARFRRRLVEIVEVIENGDSITAPEQSVGEVAADEPGAARDKHMGCHLLAFSGIACHRLWSSRQWLHLGAKCEPVC